MIYGAEIYVETNRSKQLLRTIDLLNTKNKFGNLNIENNITKFVRTIKKNETIRLKLSINFAGWNIVKWKSVNKNLYRNNYLITNKNDILSFGRKNKIHIFIPTVKLQLPRLISFK